MTPTWYQKTFIYGDTDQAAKTVADWLNELAQIGPLMRVLYIPSNQTTAGPIVLVEMGEKYP